MMVPGRTRTEGHRTLEAAGREIRDAQGTERDEILAAQRALRHAEKTHDQTVRDAERGVARARAPHAIAAYRDQLILYDDRLTTPGQSHKIARGLRASVHQVESSGETELVVEAPDWRETVRGPREDGEQLRQLAEAVQRAATSARDVIGARQPAVDAAQVGLDAARQDRLHVAEAAPLVHRVAELCADEQLLDMAPGLWTGHDGVLVATDQRLLFVGVRQSLSLPYGEIRSLHYAGRFFGARLIVTTNSGRARIGGLSPERAAELVALVTPRVEETQGVHPRAPSTG